MSSTRFQLVLALCLTAAAPGLASAQDAVVPDDFGTISAAVASAADLNGDGVIDILVRPGTYVENVQISRSNLTLRGQDAATVVLQGTGGIDTLRVRDASSVRIRRMTVIGIGSGGSDDAVDFNRVTGCLVHSVNTDGGDTGIDISNSQDCQVVSSHVTGALTEGLKVQRSSRVDVTLSSSRNNGHQGFDVDESDNVRMGRNEATGNGDSGFRDRSSSGDLYVQNVSTSNVDNGYRIENSNNTTLRRNTGSGNFSNGLRMEETSNSRIFGNAFTGNNEWGIRREEWQNDDFAAAPGIQQPPGDNDVSGNGSGEVRND